MHDRWIRSDRAAPPAAWQAGCGPRSSASGANACANADAIANAVGGVCTGPNGQNLCAVDIDIQIPPIDIPPITPQPPPTAPPTVPPPTPTPAPPSTPDPTPTTIRDVVSASTVSGTSSTAFGALALPRLVGGSLRLATFGTATLSAIVSAPILLFLPDSNPGGAGSALYGRNELGAWMAASGGGSSGFNNGGATTPGDPNQFDPDKAPLRRIHSPETIRSGNSSSYNYWRQRSTDEIVRSLRVGAEEPLIVRPDGRVYQGNTRILILEERGFDINTLAREILP